MPDPAGGRLAGTRPQHILAFGLLLVLFLFIVTRSVSSEPYVYDEADYMYAASRGFFANWSDTPSMAIAAFVRAGFSGDGRRAMSNQIRSGDDVLFYRHFHGPLFQYLLIPVARLASSEREVRMAMLAVPCASLAVIYFGCLSLAGARPALLASMLFLTSNSVLSSTELAPHQLFALCSLASLILLLKAQATGVRHYWYGAALMAGSAFCTLEVGLVLVAAIAICVWREQRRLLASCGGIFLATILAIWPASIVRLSALKAFAVMAYLVAARVGAWGSEGFIDTWQARISESPVEWALLAIALAIGWRNVRRFYPVALFIALVILATLRVWTSTPRYSLAFMPELDMLAGLALVPLGRRPASPSVNIAHNAADRDCIPHLASAGAVRFAVVVLAVAGLYGHAWYRAAHRPHNSNPRSTAVLTYIHQMRLENKAVLASQADLPTLHYYFPGMRVRGYLGKTPRPTDFVGFDADAVIPASEP